MRAAAADTHGAFGHHDLDDFISLNQSQSAPTHEAWQNLKSEMPDILERFYTSLAGIPSLQNLIDTSGSSADVLKSAQMKHWEFLFENDLDLEFQGRAIRIGEAHIRVGLPMRWYIASYGRLLNEALPVLVNKNRLSPKKLTKLLQALVSRIFIDMIHANQAFESGTLEKQRREQKEELNLSNLGNLASTTHEINAITMNMAYLSRNTEQAANGAQTISSAVEQLAASVREISENSNNATTDASETAQSANESLEAMRTVANSIYRISAKSSDSEQSLNELNEASEQIGDFLSVIENIASQTNLLALNATIEAARAGEAGKGFAVVAAEVKNLAQQSAQATEDISRRIALLKSGVSAIQETMNESREAVGEGEESIGRANELIEKMGSQIATVSGRMQEISGILTQQMDASQEIASRVSEVADLASSNDDLLSNINGVLQKCNDEFSGSAQNWFSPESPVSFCEMTKIDHIMFKKQVVDTVLGRNDWKSADVPDHLTCRLGKWYGNIKIQAIREHPAYIAMEEPHKVVHSAAKKALEAKKAGDDEAAFRALQEMDTAGEQVIAHLNSLTKAFQEELKNAEKRHFMRAPAHGHLQIEIDGHMRTVEIVDESSGGLGISGALPGDMGKTIRILRNGHEQIAEIVWVSGDRAGIRYMTYSDDE